MQYFYDFCTLLSQFYLRPNLFPFSFGLSSNYLLRKHHVSRSSFSSTFAKFCLKVFFVKLSSVVVINFSQYSRAALKKCTSPDSPIKQKFGLVIFKFQNYLWNWFCIFSKLSNPSFQFLYRFVAYSKCPCLSLFLSLFLCFSLSPRQLAWLLTAFQH